jgi:hypothetical protein
VFLTRDALDEMDESEVALQLQPIGGATRTMTVTNEAATWAFGTTVRTGNAVGVTADPLAVATSNGQRRGGMGRTAKSRGVANGAMRGAADEVRYRYLVVMSLAVVVEMLL